MKSLIKALLDSYSEIIFTQGHVIGFLLFLVTMLNPNVGLAGVISALSAYGFAFLIHLKMSDIRPGFFTYNPLLVGLSIGYVFTITPLTALFIAMAGALAFLFTYAMYHFSSYYLRLPALSLPFVVVSSLAYLASARYSNLFVSSLHSPFHLDPPAGTPQWAAGFLQSMGAILFQPNVLAGLAISAAILYWSRILFMLAVAGYMAGVLVRTLMLGSLTQPLQDAGNFNFILIAMALGGVFLIPSAKSYILAMIAVCLSTLLLDAAGSFWAYYGITAFALPFNAVCLAMIYCLGLAAFPYVARSIQSSPEKTLDHFISHNARFGGSQRAMALPFSGGWTVSQAFDGYFTHKGSWRHGYDFVIADHSGATHNGGGALEDYFAHKKPVLSPVQGRVVKVVDHLADNVIGWPDSVNNWGNLVIIEDHRGFFAEISHFAQKTIKVKPGDWVERGALLGLCGNSGYSPFPHIHVQAQLTRDIGSATIPFCFASYTTGQEYHAFGLPAINDVVQPSLADGKMEARLTLLPDEALEYEVTRGGISHRRLRLMVKMDPFGALHFDSGRGKLFFGIYENTFFTYGVEGADELLNMIFLALPSVPLCGKKGIRWTDHPPVHAFPAGQRRGLLLFLASFYHKLGAAGVNLAMVDEDNISGRAVILPLNMAMDVSAGFDASPGFHTLRVNDYYFQRVRHEARHS
jgi:urea transporter